MKFAKRGDRKIVQQNFNKEKIFLTKAGQTYNVYDAIQAANIDTDIYEVLQKYHCNIDEGAEYMKQKGGMQGIYGEFAELQQQCQSMQDVIKLKEKADEMFYNLPLEIRNKYGHNLNKFFEDLEQKSKEQKSKQETKKETIEEVNKDEQK